MPRTTTGNVRRSRRRTEPQSEQRLLEIETSDTVGSPAVPSTSEPTTFRWLWYLLSLGVPFAGVLIGLFLYDHASRTVRLIGRNSLLIGFVVWVLMPLALVVLLSLLGALAAMDWLSNAFPSGS